jgi:hypothetical protein
MLYKILILVILLNPTKIKLIKSKIRGYKSFILLKKGVSNKNPQTINVHIIYLRRNTYYLVFFILYKITKSFPFITLNK